MPRLTSTFFAALLLLGLACAGFDPATFAPPAPPPDTFLGTWEGNGLVVSISPDGMVKVEHTGATRSSVQMPGRSFEPDNITLGIGPIASRYELQAGPHAEADGSWQMTFDGVVLTRTGAAPLRAPPTLDLPAPIPAPDVAPQDPAPLPPL